MNSKTQFAPEIILNCIFILTCVLAALNPILFKDFLSQNFVFPIVAEMLSIGYLAIFLAYIQDKELGAKGLIFGYLIITTIFLTAAAALNAWFLLVFSMLSLIAKLSGAHKQPTLYREKIGIRGMIWIVTIFTIPLAPLFLLALSTTTQLDVSLLESMITIHSPENIGGFFWYILYCLLTTIFLLKTKRAQNLSKTVQ